MKSIINIMLAITVVFISASCVSTTEEFSKRSNSTRSDVFVEAPSGGNVPAGLVDLVIKASIKIPLKSYYIVESKTSAPSIRDYPFLVNIDGQAVLWKVNGQMDTLSRCENGHLNRDPDAGEGLKYCFKKRIRLAAGLHKIVFGLPNEDYLSEFNVSLNEGGTQVLEFKPRYHFISKIDRIPSFQKGFIRYGAVLNGQIVHAVVSDYGAYGFKVFLPTS